MNRSLLVASFMLAVAIPICAHAQGAEPHSWLNTETLKTRSGDFEFRNGYPAGDSAERLLELQKFNRAVEVYTTQIMPVSEIALREGMRAFGARKPQQVVIWEDLMDAKTVLLTANTETVYGMGPSRPEDRRGDGGPGAAAHARFPSGRPATLRRRHRALGSRQGQRRQVPHPAAGLPGQRAGRVFRRHVSHLLGDVCGARLPGRGQDRASGWPDEADQDLSSRQGRRLRLRCSS